MSVQNDPDRQKAIGRSILRNLDSQRINKRSGDVQNSRGTRLEELTQFIGYVNDNIYLHKMQLTYYSEISWDRSQAIIRGT